MPEEPDYIRAPTLSEAYFSTANEFMREAERCLCGPSPAPVYILTMSCGLIVELLLKALLATKTEFNDERVLRKYGHNLLCLWVTAAAQRLADITPPPPDWVEQLQRVYDFPYVIRYGKQNIAVLPNIDAMKQGTRELFDAVGKTMRS